MKTIVHPVSGKTRRLGRKPSAPAHGLRFGADLKAAKPPVTKRRDEGFFAHGAGRIADWAAADPTNMIDVKATFWLFEGFYVGASQPDECLNPMPDGEGFMWANAGGPSPEVTNRASKKAASGFDFAALTADLTALR